MLKTRSSYYIYQDSKVGRIETGCFETFFTNPALLLVSTNERADLVRTEVFSQSEQS